MGAHVDITVANAPSFARSALIRQPVLWAQCALVERAEESLDILLRKGTGNNQIIKATVVGSQRATRRLRRKL